MPANTAHIVGSVVIFSLAFLVMIGMWLRPAALLLALIMLCSSYVANFGPEGLLAISDFSRDIVLIGALMLTYVHTDLRSASRRAMLRWTPRVRTIRPKQSIAPRRVTNDTPSSIARPEANLKTKPADSDEISGEDFDLALAS